MKEIKELLDIFNNNKYKVKVLKENIQLPNEVDIKNIVIYYVNYMYYQKINDDYFNKLIDFVCIPNNFILEIKSLDMFIDIQQYIKYNIKNLDILLNNEETLEISIDYSKMKVSELKKECKRRGIRRFWKLRKKQLVIKLNNPN